MSYQPIHHKYRPQTFTQLVGQDAIATTLSNALKQNRIAPAYLFTGARGTGKTSSARIFAKSLNCIASNAPTDNPCGVCQTCQEITKGIALDVIEIDAASNTGVDNIRELIERAQFAPVQCRYKVYAIDECHMLSNAAFNSLLKTLEEPPDRVVFILATTDPQRVLPTIISRCQRFDFRRIPIEPMVQHLHTIAQLEKISITDEALYLIAQISQGGLRDAESLLDQMSLLSGEVTVDRVWDLVGAVPERDLMTLLMAIANYQPETVLDTTRRLMDRGREPLIVLQNLASFYRDLLIAKTAPDRNDLVALTQPTWKQLCSFAQSFSVPQILAGQQHLKESELQIKNTTQPRLWLEVTLMGLFPSSFKPEPQAAIGQRPEPTKPTVLAVQKSSVTPKLESLSSVEELLAKRPAEMTPIEPTRAENNASKTAHTPNTEQINLEQQWQRILNSIEPESAKGLVSANCFLLALKDDEVIIGVKSKSMLSMIQQKRSQLGKACAKTLKGGLKLSLQVADPPAPSATPIDAAHNTERIELAPSSNSNDAEVSAQPVLSAPRSESLDASRSSEGTVSNGEASRAEASESVAASRPAWQDDEVTRAARHLAEAFNGSVVNLESESSESPELTVPEAGTIDVTAIAEQASYGIDDPSDDDDDDVQF